MSIVFTTHRHMIPSLWPQNQHWNSWWCFDSCNMGSGWKSAAVRSSRRYNCKEK